MSQRGVATRGVRPHLEVDAVAPPEVHVVVVRGLAAAVLGQLVRDRRTQQASAVEAGQQAVGAAGVGVCRFLVRRSGPDDAHDGLRGGHVAQDSGGRPRPVGHEREADAVVVTSGGQPLAVGAERDRADGQGVQSLAEDDLQRTRGALGQRHQPARGRDRREVR